jgi:hypothetical protein
MRSPNKVSVHALDIEEPLHTENNGDYADQRRVKNDLPETPRYF